MIIGGGPAGSTAATYAARLGAEVTMVERDMVGGAANLWDCIPSKTMIATGGAMSFVRRATGMGLEQAIAEVDTEPCRAGSRASSAGSGRALGLLASQNVRMDRGVAQFVGPKAARGHRGSWRRGAGGRQRTGVHRLAAPHPRGANLTESGS